MKTAEVEKWLEEVSAIESQDETARKFEEFMILGSLLYDNEGNWIPRFESSQTFEVKPAKIKNGETVL